MLPATAESLSCIQTLSICWASNIGLSIRGLLYKTLTNCYWLCGNGRGPLPLQLANALSWVRYAGIFGWCLIWEESKEIQETCIVISRHFNGKFSSTIIITHCVLYPTGGYGPFSYCAICLDPAPIASSTTENKTTYLRSKYLTLGPYIFWRAGGILLHSCPQ